MKVIFTEKNVSAPVRSAIARMSRRARVASAELYIKYGSPEDHCDQLLEAQRIEKQK